MIDVPNTYASELSLERRTVMLKLHGGLDRARARAESFVVTEDDYIDYLAHGDVGGAIPVALAAKLRRSHFLFLGYGMRDWNLRLVLERMWGSSGVDLPVVGGAARARSRSSGSSGGRATSTCSSVRSTSTSTRSAGTSAATEATA